MSAGGLAALEQVKFTLLPHMARPGFIRMEVFTGGSGRIEEIHPGHHHHHHLQPLERQSRCGIELFAHIRTVDLEEDRSGVKGLHPCAADAVPGLTVVPPAVIRLHLRDGVILAKPNETPFPVQGVPTVPHRGAGLTAAGENYSSSSDDVIARTDRQGRSVRRI